VNNSYGTLRVDRDYYTVLPVEYSVSFSVLMLMAVQQEGHSVCENCSSSTPTTWVDRNSGKSVPVEQKVKSSRPIGSSKYNNLFA